MGIFELNTHISNRPLRPLDDRRLAASLERVISKLKSTPGSDPKALARASASLRALRRRRKRVLLSSASSGSMTHSQLDSLMSTAAHHEITSLADLDPRDIKILQQFSDAHAGHNTRLVRRTAPTKASTINSITRAPKKASSTLQSQSTTGIAPRLECMPAEILELVFVYSRNMELPLVCRAIYNKLISRTSHHHHKAPTPFSGKGLQLQMLRYLSLPVHGYDPDNTDATVFAHFLTHHHHHHNNDKNKQPSRALRAIDEQVLSLRFVTAELLARTGIRFVVPNANTNSHQMKTMRAISSPTDLEDLGARPLDLPSEILTPVTGAKPAGMLSERRRQLVMYLLQFENYRIPLRDTEPGSARKQAAVSGPLLVSCIQMRDVNALHKLQSFMYTQTSTITTRNEDGDEQEEQVTTTKQLLMVRPEVLLFALQTLDTEIMRTVLAMAPSDTKNNDRVWAYILQTKNTVIKQLIFEAGGRPSLQALSRM